MYELIAISAGSLTSAVLLTVSHLALWQYRDRLHRTTAYTVGCICVGIGISVAALLLNDLRIALVFWACLLPGGALIRCYWWVRGVSTQILAERTADALDAGRIQGEALSGSDGTA